MIVLSNQASEANITSGLTEALVGNKEIFLSGDLPDSKLLEGQYITARRVTSKFLKFYYYTFPFQVESISQNEIKINVVGMTATYKQTSPYAYQMTEGANVFLPNKTMYFHVNEGKVERISTTFADYLPMKESNYFLIANVIAVVVCSVYFVVASLVLIAKVILRKRKQLSISNVFKWHAMVTLSGMALLINIAILVARMLASYSRSYSEVVIHVILNYVFTATGIIGLFFMIRSNEKTQLTKLQKVIYVKSGIMLLCLVSLLAFWKFYS